MVTPEEKGVDSVKRSTGHIHTHRQRTTPPTPRNREMVYT